jgi:hypothetical protein
MASAPAASPGMSNGLLDAIQGGVKLRKASESPTAAPAAPAPKKDRPVSLRTQLATQMERLDSMRPRQSTIDENDDDDDW